MVVLGLGQRLGQDSSLVVAGAILTVAAIFQPARRRIQRVVDRRFNRRRHDTAQTIDAFSTRLHQQIDLDTLTAELLGVVDQTMQPTQASLWLRQGPSNGLAAAVGPGTHHQSRRPEWEWRRSRKLVSWDARDCAPAPRGRLNRPSSTIPLVVGRRRRPIDGLSIS